jgi:hypothetical protein
MNKKLLAASLFLLGTPALSHDEAAGKQTGRSAEKQTEMSGRGGSGQAGERKLAKDSRISAVDMGQTITVRPDELKWGDAPPGLPRGAKVAVLEGDPSKPNAHYTLRLKVPANYKVAPHYHPADERITVLSGTFMFGHGDKWDASQLKSYSVGTFYGLPAGMTHFAQAKQETVMQIEGLGPFEIYYINPADDPRTGTGGAGSEGKTP